VLVPVDLTPHSDAAVQAAASLAPGADIEVFHAIESAREATLREAGVTQAVLREARARDAARIHARMRRAVARMGLDGPRVNFSLTDDHPVPSTLRVARAADADLVIVSPGSASPGIRFLTGSVSHRLLSLVECDTVIVPRVARAPRRCADGALGAGVVDVVGVAHGRRRRADARHAASDVAQADSARPRAASDAVDTYGESAAKKRHSRCAHGPE
jgi:nucleotide-binding universal stress UspA family protein